MSETRSWARVVGDVNFRLRRGAWYEVSRFRRDAAILAVNGHSLSMPRSTLEIATHRPPFWSVVERPYDAVNLPRSWGSRYAVCPGCSHRTPINGHPMEMVCPRCRGMFMVP